MYRGRILYVILHHDFSGAEIMHAPVMEADPDPLLACPPGSETEAFAGRLGVPTVPLPYRPLRISGGRAETMRSVGAGLRTARDLRRVLRAHPERRLVYCTSTRPAMVASLAAIGLGRRVLWCLPDFLPRGPIGAAVRILMRVRASGALALSEGIKEDFAGRSGRLRDLIGVVYPGVDLSRFDDSATAPGAPVAAIVGHVSPTKRTDLAVDVAARVAREAPGFALRILGRAQFRDEDFRLERELRERVGGDPVLARTVEFRGYAEDVRTELQGCGMLLHCRSDEPFGIVVIEAMALGLPVVAPAAGGPLEIVEDGVSGLLYPPGDAAAAAELVLRLIRDGELARRMGRAARARVEERFSVARQRAEIEALLDGMDA